MLTFALTLLAVFVMIAIVIWSDNNSMHKAEHDDFFHEHKA